MRVLNPGGARIDGPAPVSLGGAAGVVTLGFASAKGVGCTSSVAGSPEGRSLLSRGATSSIARATLMVSVDILHEKTKLHHHTQHAQDFKKDIHQYMYYACDITVARGALGHERKGLSQLLHEA